ncbi:EF-hand domain-containing protein [Gilvimarinus polysaccharolyticus]|uniref:EF-hand domain-containing protein n=1 Tax=Gilvimarinus polysaccharolyticus TaxID=863921 RepID=UPI0006735F4A|nr:EF-hand domain-containing protein [Gilvimarinus polysaccharolyticus]
MKRLKTNILITSSALLLVSSLASAASHHKAEYIRQYDLNENGSLEKKEFDQARRARFDATDSNNNGVVDVEEYTYEYENRLDKKIADERESHIKQTGIRFSSLDKNEDKKMAWDEYAASGSRIFSRYDTNKDGQIDSSDPKPKAYQAEQELSDEEKQKREDMKQKWQNRVIKMSSTHGIEGIYERYDVGSDEVVTRKEFDLQRRATFRLSDENHDGWVSEDEYTLEYEDRLDAEISSTRRAQIKQTYVRFGVLDQDENGEMTFDEFQASGHRSFTRWDTNQDDVVNMNDAAPKPHKKKNTDSEKNTKEDTAY